MVSAFLLEAQPQHVMQCLARNFFTSTAHNCLKTCMFVIAKGY